jgi:hypothetical protein
MSNPAQRWATLTRPSDGLAAKLHPRSADVWLALDPDGRRHLLVRANNEEPDQLLMTTRGLRAVVARLSIDREDHNAWVDIVCLDPVLNDTFLAVADSLVEEARRLPSNLLEAVNTTLGKWQWFWGVAQASLSDERAVGLFGELWFIDRWAPFPEILDKWLGPEGYRHDFASAAIAVEVKTTQVRSDGAARHRITNLDQLAPPEGGLLYLFSLQAIRDSNASNTLPGIIDRIDRRLASRPELAGLFGQRLAKAGWSPAYADRHTQPYRIIAEEIYRVDGNFPRLRRESFVGGVPPGVGEITYNLDLAACSEYRIASNPAQAEEILSTFK